MCPKQPAQRFHPWPRLGTRKSLPFKVLDVGMLYDVNRDSCSRLINVLGKSVQEQIICARIQMPMSLDRISEVEYILLPFRDQNCKTFRTEH
jgi:hypothetical protein